MTVPAKWPGGSGQNFHGLADFLGGNRQVVLGLQVHPELGLNVEPVPESKRRIPGDRPLSGNDLRHAIGRHGDLAGELGRRDTELL